MKLVTLTLALAAALTLSGCSDLVSLNPVVTAGQAITDANLAGTWKSDGELYIIEPGKAGYTITNTDGKGTSIKFTGTLFKAGDAELLDLVPQDAAFLQLPVHAVLRIWMTGNQLQFVFLDTKWLRQLATEQLGAVPYNDGSVVTSPSEALGAFYGKFGADPKAYEGDVKVLTRL